MSLILTIGSVFAVNAQQQKETKKNNTAEVTFDVNMHCHNCQSRIEKNVSWEKGVKDLKVNLENKTVIITYDPRKTNEEKLKAAFEKLGYTCTAKADE